MYIQSVRGIIPAFRVSHLAYLHSGLPLPAVAFAALMVSASQRLLQTSPHGNALAFG